MCLLSTFCPCVQFALNQEKLDDDSPFLVNCCVYLLCLHCYLCCLVHGGRREELRARYGLEEEPCPDYLITCFMPSCTLSQEAREMASRGPPPPMTMTASPVVVVQQAAAPSYYYTTQPVHIPVAHPLQPSHAQALAPPACQPSAPSAEMIAYADSGRSTVQ